MKSKLIKSTLIVAVAFCVSAIASFAAVPVMSSSSAQGSVEHVAEDHQYVYKCSIIHKNGDSIELSYEGRSNDGKDKASRKLNMTAEKLNLYFNKIGVRNANLYNVKDNLNEVITSPKKLEEKEIWELAFKQHSGK